MADNALVRRNRTPLATKEQPTDLVRAFERAAGEIREEIRDNPYLEEAFRVLPVGGLRSAIGSFWNVVVDDLRNKVIHRSVALFNKSVDVGRTVKTYEDFQNHVNDDELIDGAYKIGVISWEASKVLKHAKETRHIFSGHPKSTDPTAIKVLSMLEDCVKYVLSEGYPSQIIDVDDYLAQMASDKYDRNDVAIEVALSELPDVYKEELVNRMFTSYGKQEASSILRGNIEFAAPILWGVLAKAVRIQVVRRVDREISDGDGERTRHAFAFVNAVGGQKYLSGVARRYIVKPIIDRLVENLDKWSVENECVRDLEAYAGYIPDDLVPAYVKGLVMTYVGYMGGSAYFARKDFYANTAAVKIPGLFEKFDDQAAEAFIEAIVGNVELRNRIAHPAKILRLRTLGKIVHERVSDTFSQMDFLELLLDETREKEFIRAIAPATPPKRGR